MSPLDAAMKRYMDAYAVAVPVLNQAWITSTSQMPPMAAMFELPESLSRASTPLSRENAIGKLGADGKSAAYVIASAAAGEIAARKGNEGLFRFLEAFNDSTITGPPGARTTDKVMRKSIGMTLRELDAAIG